MSTVLASMSDPDHVRSVWAAIGAMTAIVGPTIAVPVAIVARMIRRDRAAATVAARPVMSTPTTAAAVSIVRVSA